MRPAALRLPALVTLTLATLALAGAARAQNNHQNDFESYAVGTHPGSPWYTIFSGASGYVTDEQAHAGTRSFRIENHPTWARWECVSIGTIPDWVGYRGWVMVATAGRGGALGFGFVQPGVPNTGRWANAVVFLNDGRLIFDPIMQPHVELGTWQPGAWTRIEVHIDYVAELANVYVGIGPGVTGVPCDPKIIPASVYGAPVPLDQFGFMGDNFGGGGTSVLYLDDVAVGEAAVGAVPSSWARIKQLYR
jgi:hypothetical protein